MSIAIYRYVCCDRCGSPGPLGDSAEEARRSARRERWDVRGQAKYDMCPACSQGVRYHEKNGEFWPTPRPAALPGWIEEIT